MNDEASPFPPAWRAIIARHLPFAARLSGAERRELERLVVRFVAEKHFEGCGGLRLHDVHRVTIAAHAALLTLGGNSDGFPRLTTILVYPDDYVVDEPHEIAEGIVVEGPAWHAGHTQSDLRVVVVSWRDALEGIRNPRDGQNVLLHELAHQLDFESGEDDGVPAHDDAASARRFREVCRQEYERLGEAVDQDLETLLDPYGAEHPSEFFAVATEAFFGLPEPLRERHPDLYQVLSDYYRQDPAAAASDR